MIRVFIKSDQIYSKPLEYTLSILAKNKLFSITLTNDKSIAQLIFDHTDPISLPINIEFYDSLLNKKVFNHESYFKNVPYLIFPDSNEPDWLGSAFYMINSFQEYSDISTDCSDKYERFRYDKSYQHKFNCIEKNLVQEYFDNFCKEHPASIDIPKAVRSPKVFLSHDIDTIYGSFMQDGLWAIKKGRLDIVLKLIMNEILSTPHWKNIDKIAKLHSEYDLKSTFFWLATKKTDIKNKVKNADYSIGKLNNQLKNSNSNGLHKSCYNTSFSQELSMLPFNTTLNRYHFLKFSLPASWNEIEKSEITLDASLGFTERFGFRNNYSLPFQPYNLNTKTFYNFVEVPLNIMDGSLHRSMKIPVSETATHIIDFLNKNCNNSIISILWHNTYFTNYKYSGYLQEYKKVLLFLTESGIKSITPEEILNEYKNE